MQLLKFLHFNSILKSSSLSGILARGLACDLGLQIVSFALNMWLTAIAISSVGVSYGLWIAGFALLSIVGIFEFGLSPYVVRTAAELKNLSADSKVWGEFFGTVFASHLIVAMVSISFGLLISPLIVDFICANDTTDQKQLLTAFNTAVLFFALAQPLNIFRSIVHGTRDLSLLSLINLVECLTSFVTVSVGLHYSQQLVIIPIALLLTAVITSLCSYLLIPKSIRPALLGSFGFSRNRFAAIIQYGKPILISKISFLIRERTDEPVASHFLSGQSVLEYNATLRLVKIPISLIGRMTTLAIAPLTTTVMTEQPEKLKQLALCFFRGLLIFSFSSAATLWLINPAVIKLWLGSSYYAGDLLCALFCSWIVIESLSRGLSVLLWAKGEHHVLTRPQALEALINLALSILLVQTWGLVGIALGTTIASAITTAWAVPRLIFASLDIGAQNLLSITQAKFYLKLLVLTATICIGRLLPNIASEWSRLALQLGWAALVTLAFLWKDFYLLLKAKSDS